MTGYWPSHFGAPYADLQRLHAPRETGTYLMSRTLVLIIQTVATCPVSPILHAGKVGALDLEHAYWSVTSRVDQQSSLATLEQAKKETRGGQPDFTDQRHQPLSTAYLRGLQSSFRRLMGTSSAGVCLRK